MRRPQNIKSKSKVRIEGTTENKSFSITWVDPRKVFQPYPDPKNIPSRPQKAKRPQISQNKKSELKKTYKMKIVQLHE